MATSIEWRLLSDQQTYLFTDFRHIDPGDLEWIAPDGEPLPTKPGAESPPGSGRTRYPGQLPLAAPATRHPPRGAAGAEDRTTRPGHRHQRPAP